LEEDVITDDLPEIQVESALDVAVTEATTLTSQITKKDVTTTSSYSAITELPDIDDDGNVFLPSAPSAPITVNVQNSIIETQSKQVLADTLGVSAELIDVDYVEDKNASAANMIYPDFIFNDNYTKCRYNIWR
jgi:ribonuclease PH